jgi:imidazolonepropionase-like amidohydrolase
VYIVANGVIENSVILVENGKIARVLRGIDVPSDATVVEAPVSYRG